MQLIITNKQNFRTKMQDIDAQEMLELIKSASFDKDIDVIIDTTKGKINLTLFAEKCPMTVRNCHRTFLSE